ncbi:MAG TPA: GNAT family N-acetyltransferase [Clostridia bacterium]|nr:GNAT family N-acetyltransferase [Clostridia bacterium]
MSFTFRRIKADEYDAARALWDAVFPEDADGFSAYYFSRRTKPEYVFAAFDGNKMVGDLHAVPYPLRFGSAVKPCAMVGGVATLPEYRRRGIAGSLIRLVHEELREQGVAAAVLKPDVDFYAQFGYLPFAYHDEYELTAGQAAAFPQSALRDAEPSAMLALYGPFAERFAGMMARNLVDMELYLEETLLAGFAVTDGNAYALCKEGGDGVEVAELVGFNPLPLVSKLADRYGKVAFRLPASMELGGLYPASRMMFSMICPLDEAKLVEGTGAASAGEILDGALGPCCTLEFC